jgi:GNAT superfamily N-acetyltransferase
MIEVRRAESDADLEGWIRVKRAVLPNESAWTIEDFRTRLTPDRTVLVAERDGEIVGAGLGGRSDDPRRGYVAPRVHPESRRFGVGAVLLGRLLEFVDSLGLVRVSGQVTDAGSKAFAERFGFVESDRQVEQVRRLDGEIAVDPIPDEVEVVTVAERPELLEAAYPLARDEGYPELALEGSISIPLDEWLHDEATLPEGSFVALADGQIVGYSGLMAHDNDGVAEDGLTVVRRDWRRRGLAKALKQRELAWATAAGFAEVVTWTQNGNESMRTVNERLGYEYRDVAITMSAALPLENGIAL